VKTSALIVALLSGLSSTAVVAQQSLDAPPPLPPATTPVPPAVVAPPAQAPAQAKDGSKRRTVARLSEAERAKQEAQAQSSAELTEPSDDELLPPARQAAPETRIEQRRQGNRVVEIVVTPQGSTNSYVIVNREGRPPLTTQELSSGLSTPRFLRFDF
jgi:hypothetical protein